MRAITRKRLLKVANDAETLSNVRKVAAELFEHHREMEAALKGGNVGALSKAIHASKKAIQSLRYVLGVRGES